MRHKLYFIGNLLLSLCLLFTFTFSHAIPASAKTSKQDITIEVRSDDEVFFEFVAENKDEDSTYSVRITEKESKYLWESKIEVDGKTVSETEFKINKIRENYEPEELEIRILNVILGKEDSNVLDEYLNDVFDIASDQSENKYSDNNDGKVRAQVAPLVIPLAAGAISSSALASLEAALFATLAAGTAAVATGILEDRHRSSDEEAEISTRKTYPDNWDEFTGIPSARSTSATKHIELSGVNEIVDRIHNDRRNDGDLEIFISTTEPRGSVLLVYDINSTLRTTVNRHLGNYVDGSQIRDRFYNNERLNLDGYTVFLIFSERRQELFHVHFVPQSDRTKELKYMRYRGNFDLQIFDRVSYDPSYNRDLQTTSRDQLNWEKNYERAMNNRNLLRDTTGKRSVVPYK